MIRPHSVTVALFVAAIFSAAGSPLLAQGRDPAADFTRTNPKFLGAFKEVVAKPAASTVRIVCGGKDTALGVVVGPDGWILTKANDLVLPITVRIKSQDYDAELIGIHAPHDLALLKIDARGLTPIEFSESKKSEVGSWIACVGATGDPVAVGVISVAAREVKNAGPILDQAKMPYLGVSLEAAKGGGVRINQIVDGAPSAKAGLKVNDVILKLSGKKIESPESFTQAIGGHVPGDVVRLTIRRGEEEFEKSATLARKPLGSARGEMQNKMGSDLSNRRTGYASILQHDSVVRPADCGGPIVDLDGKVLGINICRAGRVESWAVPSESIQPLLLELMSGRLSPAKAGFAPPKLSPDERVAAAKSALARAERDKSRFEKEIDEARKSLQSAESELKAYRQKESSEAVDRMLGLMQKRLLVMNDVAGWKWNHRQEVLDPAREKESITKLQQRAAELKIEPRAVKRLFESQFEAARLLQQDRMAGWAKDNALANVKGDLTKDLRPRIDELNTELLETFGVLLRYWKDESLGLPELVRNRADQTIAGQGINADIRRKALEGLFLP